MSCSILHHLHPEQLKEHIVQAQPFFGSNAVVDEVNAAAPPTPIPAGTDPYWRAGANPDIIPGSGPDSDPGRCHDSAKMAGDAGANPAGAAWG